MEPWEDSDLWKDCVDEYVEYSTYVLSDEYVGNPEFDIYELAQWILNLEGFLIAKDLRP